MKTIKRMIFRIRHWLAIRAIERKWGKFGPVEF